MLFLGNDHIIYILGIDEAMEGGKYKLALPPIEKEDINKRGASIDLRHAAGKIPEEQLMCILFNFFAGMA